MCKDQNQLPDLVHVDDNDFCDRELDEIKTLQFQAGKQRRSSYWVARNVLVFGIFHVAAAYGLYLSIYHAKWQTVSFAVVGWIAAVLGITCGAHRLWSHKSYKAKTPFRVMLMLFQTMAVQNSVIEWVRDHRCHHKWTDTDADPHNASRGIMFSHFGWLLQRKHPAVKEMGQKIDLSDLNDDAVIVFQQKYYGSLAIIFGFLVPSAIPVLLWGENALISFFVAGIFRYVISLHDTWTINSLAHYLGHRPYDGRILAADNYFIALFTVGEGGHNYHHTFPSDYRTSEYEYAFNLGKVLIDFGALLGQVYDRKIVGQEFINRRIAANNSLYGKCEEYEKFAATRHLH